MVCILAYELVKELSSILTSSPRHAAARRRDLGDPQSVVIGGDDQRG